MHQRRIEALRGRLIDADERIAWVGAEVAGTDSRIGCLATLQHGVVTWVQLRRLGLSEKAIRHRIATGRLRPIHRGVYTVGHDSIGEEGRWAAAVLAVEPGALSHWSAATALRFGRGGGPIHVTSARARRPRPGLVIHSAQLPEDELSTRNGIAMTSPERTLLDLSCMTSELRLRELAREAVFVEATDLRRLAAALERHPRRAGRRNLSRVVEQMGFGQGVPRGVLEGRFIDFVRERGLPEPALNAPIVVGGNRFVLDCVWRESGLVVELDGRGAHEASDRHDRDTYRDRKLLLVGLETIRVTWRQLIEAPDELERDIRAALARGRRRQSAALEER